jgi:hypothetical protein
MGAMLLNLAANVLGLEDAATPFGLKAMRELETLNPRPGVATNAMALFLAINTSGLAVLPLRAIALRASLGSTNAAGIIALADRELLRDRCGDRGGQAARAAGLVRAGARPLGPPALADEPRPEFIAGLDRASGSPAPRGQAIHAAASCSGSSRWRSRSA